MIPDIYKEKSFFSNSKLFFCTCFLINGFENFFSQSRDTSFDNSGFCFVFESDTREPTAANRDDIMDWSEENDIMDWSEENGIMVWSEENGNTDPEVNLGFVFQHSFACFFLS